MWAEVYPSTITRAKVRERLPGFLKYCYEAQWLPRIPQVPKIQIDEPETQPLTADEYKRLLAAVPEAVKPTEARLSKLGNLRKWVDRNYAPDVTPARVHAFIQCMRWTGLCHHRRAQAAPQGPGVRQEQGDLPRGDAATENETEGDRACLRAHPERCSATAVNSAEREPAIHLLDRQRLAGQRNEELGQAIYSEVLCCGENRVQWLHEEPPAQRHVRG